MTLPSTKYDDSASPPSDGPQPGTMALRTACLERYPRLGDLGIYVRRPVRGGTAPSKHSQGRAWDAECHDQAYGRAVFDYLVAHSAQLGIQVVIWWHRIWSIPRGEHAYTGTDPHTGHLHIEQNWDGAEYLTYAAASRVLWAQPPTEPQPTPLPEEDDDMPRLVHWDGADYLVGYDLATGKALRRTLPNTSREAQLVGGGGITTDQGAPFSVTNDQFLTVYEDLGSA